MRIKLKEDEMKKIILGLMVLGLVVMFWGVVHPTTYWGVVHPTSYNEHQHKISIGGSHTIIVKGDGSVWTWGLGDRGQLGHGEEFTYPTHLEGADKNVPTKVEIISNVIAVAAGGAMGGDRSFAIKNDGTVWGWGANGNGMLGIGSTTNNYSTPVQVQNLSNVTDVSVGAWLTIALKSDGTVWTWGYGRHGNGSSVTEQLTPVQVQNLNNVIAIAAGDSQRVALKDNGTVWTWGFGGHGALGNGNSENQLTPMQVQNLSNVVAIASGSHFTIVSKSDGTVWTWGWNDMGQIGNGLYGYTDEIQFTPIQVQNVSDIVTITAGHAYSVVIKNDGTVWSWGDNQVGQLGDGNTSFHQTSPVQAQDLNDAIAIAAGMSHTIALKDDCTLWGWGSNWAGNLGNGTTGGDVLTPEQLTSFSFSTALVVSHTYDSLNRLTSVTYNDSEKISRIAYTYDSVGNRTSLTSIAPIPIDTDTDGDGMPDWWENTHGLSPDSAEGIDGPAGDIDKNGLSNLEEYLNGSNYSAEPAQIIDPPADVINNTDVTMNIGGNGVVGYKYRLDGGIWQQEAAVGIPIQLTSLSYGTHILFVIGKESDGYWQSEASAATAIWTISNSPIISLPDINVTDSVPPNDDLHIPFGEVPSTSAPFLIWKKHSDLCIRTTPVLGDNGLLYANASSDCDWDNSGIAAFDPTDGSVVWGPVIPPGCTGRIYSNFSAFGVSGMAMGANGLIYAVKEWNECGNGNLVAINGNDGSIAWECNQCGPHPRQTPALDESLNNVYFGSSSLCSVDMDSGVNNWSESGGGYIGAGGMAIDSSNNVYYGTHSGSGNTKIRSYSSDGTFRWEKQVSSIVAILPGDILLIQSGDSNALLACDNGGNTLWQLDNYAGAVVDESGNIYSKDLTSAEIVSINLEGEERWRTGLPGATATSIYFVDNPGHVYCRGDNVLYAINTNDGSLAWSFIADVDIRIAVLVLEGRIFLTDNNNTFYLLDASIDYAPSCWPTAYGNRRHTQKAGDILPLPSGVPTINNSSVQTVTISNEGEGELLVGAISIISMDAAEFLIQNNSCSEQTLASSATCTLKVAFNPTSAGLKTANLIIPSNDPDENPVTVTLSGSCNSLPSGGLASSAWPCRGHDARHTGQSPYLGAQTNTLKWSYETGDCVKSSPAVGIDGTTYVGSCDYKIYALDPNGTCKWTYPTGGAVKSSPAIGADGTIYVGSDDDKLYALDPNGSLKWECQTGGDIVSSPNIGTDGTIYFGSFDKKFYAIKHDGSLKWSYQTSSWITSSPAIGDDGTIYFGSDWNDNKIYALRPDGTLKWSYQTARGICSSPAISDDGTIYIGSQDNKLYALDPNGSLKWTYTIWAGIESSPAVRADGTLYIGSGSKVYALDPNGNLKWAYQTEGTIKSTPAIGVDGIVYTGSLAGKVYALDPNGSLKWSYQAGDAINSSPAISSDCAIYIGSDDGKVYAFHSQEETSCVLCGDADQDGVVDIFDALLVSEYDAGLKTLNDIPGLLCCDVDNNGEVDIFDALEISKYDAKIITILNCVSE